MQQKHSSQSSTELKRGWCVKQTLLQGFQIQSGREAKNVSSPAADEIPTTHTSAASSPHSIALAHILKYILKHENRSPLKGPIRNILLTFLPQEPSFLRQRTPMNGICVRVQRLYLCVEFKAGDTENRITWWGLGLDCPAMCHSGVEGALTYKSDAVSFMVVHWVVLVKRDGDKK